MPAEVVINGKPEVFMLPIVFHDLRQPESYLQCIDSLENLQRVSNAVFDAISARIVDQGKRLEGLERRIGISSNRILHLKGNANKVTTVYSPAKFPGPEKFPSFCPLFSCTPFEREKRSRYHLQDIPHTQSSNIHDPTKDYQARKEVVRVDQAQELTQEWEGLGRLPEYLPSISSLILFNTSENPYNVLMSIDNLKGRDDDENYKPQDDQDDEIETPASLLGGSTLPSYQIADYSYKPVLVDVPDLDLPLFLPELGNVGESEFDLEGFGISIAPSAKPQGAVALTDPANFLPPPPPLPSANQALPPPPSRPHGDLPTAPPSSNSFVPPPPPPPPSSTASFSAAAPPPPPPPSGALPALNLPKQVVNPDQGRSSMLEDIRKGQTSRLKKNRTRKENTEKKPKASADPTADMFANLKSMIERKRKSIAGKRSGDSDEEGDRDW